MFKQLRKHFPLTLRIRQPIFTSKTYNHAVTYNHASADGNLQYNACIYMGDTIKLLFKSN